VACLHEHIDRHYADEVRIYHSVTVDKVEQCQDEAAEFSEEATTLQVHWRGQEGRSGCITTPFMVSYGVPCLPFRCRRHVQAVLRTRSARCHVGKFRSSPQHVQVGADGASSQMLDDVAKLTDHVKCVNLKENTAATRAYKTLILPLPDNDPQWTNEASYSQRSPAGRVLECLPTKEGMPTRPNM
jgi:hypothetical protein